MNSPASSLALERPADQALPIAFGFAALLAAILDLIVTWQIKHTTDPVSYRCLAYFAIYYLLERRAAELRFAASPVAIVGGGLLLTSAISKALWITIGDDYYHFFPIILGTGLALLAFGFRELPRLWQILLILLTVSLFDNPFASFTISRLRLDEIGAWLSAHMLLVAGYPAVAQRNLVLLPAGMVEVAGGCSSAQPLLYLFKLTLLAAFIFRTRLWQSLALLAGAIAIALLGNALRIAIMAVLATAGDMVRFEFWHLGTGSNIFSMLYVVLFCTICALCLRRRGRAPTLPQSA